MATSISGPCRSIMTYKLVTHRNKLYRNINITFNLKLVNDILSINQSNTAYKYLLSQIKYEFKIPIEI